MAVPCECDWLYRNSITSKFFTVASNFVNNLPATLIFHLDFGSDGNKIFDGRMPSTVDGCGVFAVISFGA